MARGGLTSGGDVYVGMLGLACFGMVVGVLALFLEASEYDWMQKPAATPTANLPTSPGRPAGVGAIDANHAPAVATAPATTPAPSPTPSAPPAATPEPPAVAVTPAEPTPAVPTGPTPSPLAFTPRAIPPKPPAAVPTAEPAPTDPTPSPLQVRPRGR